jgi:hypothetical protein
MRDHDQVISICNVIHQCKFQNVFAYLFFIFKRPKPQSNACRRIGSSGYFLVFKLVFAWQNQINTSDTRLTTKQLVIQDRKHSNHFRSDAMPCYRLDGLTPWFTHSLRAPQRSPDR